MQGGMWGLGNLQKRKHDDEILVRLKVTIGLAPPKDSANQRSGFGCRDWAENKIENFHR